MVDVGEGEDLGALDAPDVLHGRQGGAAAEGEGAHVGLVPEHGGSEGAGGGADAVVEEVYVGGGEGLEGRRGRGEVDAEAEGSVGGSEVVVQVPAHDARVWGGFVDVGREFGREGGEGLVGEVEVVALVVPGLLVDDGVGIVAGVGVEAGDAVADDVREGHEAVVFFPAGEAVWDDRGEELVEEVVSEEDTAAPIALEVDDQLCLASCNGHGEEVLAHGMEFGWGVGFEGEQGDDGDVV